MKSLKKVIIALLIIILVPPLAYFLFMCYLTLVEYRPDATETIEPVHNEKTMDSTDDSYTIASWNIGYGALGDNADFFMDGGKSVNTASKERVEQNIKGMQEVLNEISPDFVFLQEVDRNSDRSHRINEAYEIASSMDGFSSAFAINFKVPFIPYPFPPIGKVDGGLFTLSAYDIENAERVSLPCPFGWPLRLGNLKRCLLVSRIPIEESEKELVLVNLHLEAYDSGEGKAQQTALLKTFLEQECEKGNYVVAGGDFNQTFSSIDTSKFPVHEDNWQAGTIDADSFDEYFNIFMDGDTASGRSLLAPYEGADKSSFQFYIIDGFLVSKNIDTLSVETLDYDFKVSDHNPVVLKFKLGK
ncbi:endonuclease/exonuclease/phosphatase family protein [Butyrivibrio sp. AE3004]|uniref:endonuclease/exonuclease/phosphatase family protein n=1 Tax=Butyrivibrio sp. AE3004 TaxID=1506994 RepID=UPI0004941582|nr:endonuclease/exonuclease/phosphatase family protein [Butyrivibrio sp. AE3004]